MRLFSRKSTVTEVLQPDYLLLKRPRSEPGQPYSRGTLLFYECLMCEIAADKQMGSIWPAL